MCVHTALEDLPTLLMDAGVNVIVAGGYLNGQCEGSDHYMFSDPDTGAGSHDEKPPGYMIHHTGSISATPPPAKTSKAGAWAGVYRDGKLFPTGEGIPTIYLASCGPARVSSGYGFRPAAWDYTFKGLRAPAHAEGSDGSTALNRYSFNIEIVHPGDGGELDNGVWAAVVVLGQILESMFGLTEMSLGHTSWSTRKIDPKLSVGLPHDGADCIIDFQDAIGEIVPQGCPWQTIVNPGDPWYTNYAPCDSHYDLGEPIEWGVNTGVCNVESWGIEGCDWAKANKVLNAKDNNRDDYERPLTDGRYWTFESRQ